MSGAAQGPLKFLLQSSTGQYVCLGAGLYNFFPDQMKDVIGPIAKQAMSLLDPSKVGIESKALPSNIIIQTSSPSSNGALTTKGGPRRDGHVGRGGMLGHLHCHLQW